jgi:hypothetical protein
VLPDCRLVPIVLLPVNMLLPEVLLSVQARNNIASGLCALLDRLPDGLDHVVSSFRLVLLPVSRLPVGALIEVPEENPVHGSVEHDQVAHLLKIQ